MWYRSYNIVIYDIVYDIYDIIPVIPENMKQDSLRLIQGKTYLRELFLELVSYMRTRNTLYYHDRWKWSHRKGSKPLLE